MANPDQMKILRQSVEAWNSFRIENPNRKVGLAGAGLNRAFLPYADFHDAYLVNAYLHAADLRKTNFKQAILKEVVLRSADLRGANLSGADLTGADLTDADLTDTNLTSAIFHRTIIGNNDLSVVEGLDSVRHFGPSLVGFDTLINSNGNIPEVFLRGVGLPELFITYLNSLIERPIQFYSCFISYSHVDQSFARRLHDSLQSRGVRCWLDDHALLPGDKVYTEIDRAIRLSDRVLLCCSKDSLTSWWVDNEIKIAFDKEQQLWKERGKEVLTLIPLNLDNYLFSGKWNSGLATEVKARLAANFTGWEHNNTRFEEQFERVVKALQTQMSQRGLPPPPQI